MAPQRRITEQWDGKIPVSALRVLAHAASKFYPNSPQQERDGGGAGCAAGSGGGGGNGRHAVREDVRGGQPRVAKH